MSPPRHHLVQGRAQLPGLASVQPGAFNQTAPAVSRWCSPPCPIQSAMGSGDSGYTATPESTPQPPGPARPEHRRGAQRTRTTPPPPYANGPWRPTWYDTTTSALGEASRLQYLLGRQQPEMGQVGEKLRDLVNRRVNSRIGALASRVAILEAEVEAARWYLTTGFPLEEGGRFSNTTFYDTHSPCGQTSEDEDGGEAQEARVQGVTEAAVGEGEVPAGARSTKRENM